MLRVNSGDEATFKSISNFGHIPERKKTVKILIQKMDYNCFISSSKNLHLECNKSLENF